MTETNSSLDRDTLSRNRIVSEIDENFFVEAGAGSGKTTMLVSRMVAMVEAGIDISKICAITFTKAAAGEFYDRFQKLLIQRSDPNYVVDHPERPGSLRQPDDTTRQRCAEALQNIDLCFMGTIDSFCSMVLSEHPSEAGVPSDAHIVSDADAATVYQQQYVKICAGACGEELQALAKTFQALHRSAQDVFVRGITFLMNNRNVTFDFHAVAAVDIDHDFANEKTTLLRAVKCLVDHPELKYDGNQGSRAAWEKISDSYEALQRRWSTNFTNLFYALNSLNGIRIIPEAIDRYALELGDVFVPGGKGKKPKWYEFASEEDGGLYEKPTKLRYDASMTFLMKCVPVMEQAMRDKGCLTFFDYLYYLRNMLKRDAEGGGRLIQSIYERHSYFLIDEFQDTNPMQAEVFFYLSAAYPVAKWSACLPRKGSLFIVGDPKQSIYRFRSADVSSFFRVKRLFEINGGAILSLSRNFRSTQQICSYFNQVFRELLPVETQDQSRYEDIPLPEPREDEFQGVFTYDAYIGKGADEHPDQTDPIQIADIIERLVGSGKYQLRGGKNETPRPIRYSDFMVITSRKKTLKPILAELDSRDIPTRVEGTVPFGKNEALREICAIYSAVTDQENTMALYGALTGKLLALAEEDILRYRASGGSFSLKTVFDAANCTDAAALHTAEKMGELKKLATAAAGLSPAALFSRIMDDFRVYQTLPAENLEVVYYAMELVRSAEQTGQITSLKDGAAFLTQLIADASENERCLSLDANPDCVHLANLHKVKGLEAPIVILAAASPSPSDNSPSYRIEHGEAEPRGWLFALGSKRDANGRSTAYFQTSDYSDEKAAEKATCAAEADRLIYVAATRARNVLILCNSITSIRGKEKPTSIWKPIMQLGLPNIFELLADPPKPAEKAEISVDASALYEAAQASSVLNTRRAEDASYQAENPSRLQVLSKLSESPDQPQQEHRPEEEIASAAEAEAASGAHRFPALLGTMTHKLMEMLVTTGNRLDVRAAVGEILREYRTPATEGFEAQLEEALLKVADTMRAGGYAQSNGLPQDILGTLLSADEVYCELPFNYLDETVELRTVWNGVMDVLYRKDGQWHIVDYKTNADGSDLDTRYQNQLAAYVKALKATIGFSADAMTYHIDI